MFSCFLFAVPYLNRYGTKDQGRGGPCLDQVGHGPRPRLEGGPLCSLLFSLIFFNAVFLVLSAVLFRGANSSGSGPPAGDIGPEERAG